MSILEKQITNKALASAYIFEGANKDNNLATAKDFAQKVFETYNININNVINPDLLILDKGEDIIDIDSIRKVLKDISLAPSNSEVKIYIIHNAHNMRAEGSNAMLKTIEELKTYNIVIFTTTNSQLLLPTIRSRCQLVKIDDREDKLDIDLDKLTSIMADTYRGDIVSYYKNKSFFDSFKEDRSTLLDGFLAVFENILAAKYSKKANIEENISYHVDRLIAMPVDVIEELTSLIYKIKIGFRNNINYDLAIEQIIFDIYRKGTKL